MSAAPRSTGHVADRHRPRVSAQTTSAESTPYAPACSTLSKLCTGGIGAPGPAEAAKIAAM